MFSSTIAKIRGIGWRPRIIRFQKYRVNGIVPVHAATIATRMSSCTLSVVLDSFHIVVLSAANSSKAIKGHAVVMTPIIIFLFFIGFMTERQRSPSAHLVRRSGGTPCWIPFSLAVPGFALPNRSRGVRDLCFSVVEGPSCARWLIIF